MGKVSLNINGRAYGLGCEAGEEERLMRLGQKLDERVASMAAQFGQIGDLRLMVMAGITLLDEMDELNETLETEVGRRIGHVQAENAKMAKSRDKTEARAATELDAAARRVEAVMAKLAALDVPGG